MIEKYKRITLENDIALLTQSLVGANLRKSFLINKQITQKKKELANLNSQIQTELVKARVYMPDDEFKAEGTN